MAVTLGEALLSAIAKGMIGMGEGSGGTLPDAEKNAGTEAPASDYREVVPTSSREQTAPVNLANGKRLDTAVTSRSPSGAVSRRLALIVIEGGGGRPAQGGASRAAYRADPGRVRAREFLKLVVG